MISVVIPLYNEQESISSLYEELLHTLRDLAREHEIIFVDDGSTDQSLEVLKEIEKKDKTIRIFSFRKNYGKAEALFLGFNKAKGEYIITLDADLQDKPSEIKKLLKKMDEGWDLVCGWRKDRKDPYKKILSSRFFNFVVRILWGIDLHDYNCGLKIYKRETVKDLQLYGGLHRFIPVLVLQQGFKVGEIAVSHERRLYGKSKYGFSKLWKEFPDILTMFFLTRYSNRPLHFFGAVGGTFLFVGVIILLYLSIIWFQGYSIGRRPLLLMGILLVLSGFQIFFTGFLADLIINISYKTNGNLGANKAILLKYKSD